MTDPSNWQVVLAHLLTQQRIASLATLDEQGHPFISTVPFAVCKQTHTLLIHISALAAHTQHLQARPLASIGVCTAERAGEPVHDLARVSYQVQARFLSKSSPEWGPAQSVYIQRFPDMAFLFDFKDFNLVALSPTQGRLVVGFGQARHLPQNQLLG